MRLGQGISGPEYIPPAVLIHESAHGLICTYYGHIPSIEWGMPTFDNAGEISGLVTCPAISLGSELRPYWVAGGVVAGGLFACLLSIRYIRQNIWLMAPIVAITSKEFLTAFVETVAHAPYMNSQFDLHILAALMMPWTLFWIYSYKQKKGSKKPLIGMN